MSVVSSSGSTTAARSDSAKRSPSTSTALDVAKVGSSVWMFSTT
jgi:hypothetical protein